MTLRADITETATKTERLRRRETDRYRETEKQIQRDRDGETQTDTERHRRRETERYSETDREKQRFRETEREEVWRMQENVQTRHRSRLLSARGDGMLPWFKIDISTGREHMLRFCSVQSPHPGESLLRFWFHFRYGKGGGGAL